MQSIEEFGDDRHKAWCIHCARPLAGLDTNEDHVPSKSFLTKPRPHHLPVVIICSQCNTGFSLDEQYSVTFLSCVLIGSTEPEKQPNASAARTLTDSPALRARIEQSRMTSVMPGGETRILWKPEMQRISRVVLKNARGHAYFEYSEPTFDEPASLWARPLEEMAATERQEFEGLTGDRNLAVWPEVGSRMMSRLATGADMAAGWVVVQDGVYRYSVHQEDGGLSVRSVLFEYFATKVQWDH
jgi:hypothetical protein